MASSSAHSVNMNKQDERNLKHVYNDHVNTDMTFTQFRDLCSKEEEEEDFESSFKTAISKDTPFNKSIYNDDVTFYDPIYEEEDMQNLSKENIIDRLSNQENHNVITNEQNNNILNDDFHEQGMYDIKDESNVVNTVEEDSDKLTKKFLQMLDKNRKQYIDTVYGVRKLPDGTYMIGNTQIDFEGSYINLVGKKKYSKTDGLLELIFRQKPDQKLTNANDFVNYKEILRSTNAYRKNYSPNKPIRSNKTFKYTNVIAKLLLKSGDSYLKRKTQLPQFMTVKKESYPDYVYWDDPNKIVERLRLLVASQQAGNSSHNNEIMSIIEELREAQIIY
ncbi:uncharacterized protein LOC127279711 [Leptopilina boulardi]|uniref:uncharacterized protein LOC127279711 n=1 Tax=Leptopilina boulardi TaxID=63433 RepID=UPI0021F584F0|nr:uncharacterized protein LOC127279711 [Leptopilina boulardi]